VSENNAEVLTEAYVVRHLCVESLVFLTALLAKLDRGERARDQVQVERHKGRDDECQYARQDVGRHHEIAHFVVEGVRVGQGTRDNWVARRANQQAGH